MSQIKLYFYLEGPTLKPKWTSKLSKVKHLNKLGLVTWKVNKHQKILASLRVDDYNMEQLFEGETFLQKHEEFKFKTIFDKRHLPILKSQLQKCARRQKAELAVKTAVSMVLIEDNRENVKQFGLFELLRRLTIIMIEDTVLSESFSFLTWCMAVLSKGHYLNGYCLEKIIELVKGIASSGFRDPKAYHFDMFKADVYDLVKKSIMKPMVLSTLFRSAYRGMKSDHKMLLSAAQTWMMRYFYNSPLLAWKEINTFLPIDTFEQLSKDEIQPESLDHHCTNIVDRIQKYMNYPREEIEILIWDNSSCLNTRFDIENGKLDEHEGDVKWNRIKFIHKMETKNLAYEL